MASSSDIFNSKVDNSTVPVSVQQTPTGQPNLVSKEPVPSSAICDPGEEPGSTSSSFQGIDSNSPNTESSSVTLKAMGLEIRALFEAVFKHIHTSQKVTKVPEVARPDCKDIIDSFVQMTTNNEDLYRMLLKKLHQHYEALGFLIDEYFFADQLKFLIEFQSDRFEWWAAKNGLYRGNLDACLKGNAESMAAGEERWKPEYGPGLRTQMSNLRKTLNKSK